MGNNKLSWMQVPNDKAVNSSMVTILNIKLNLGGRQNSTSNQISQADIMLNNVIYFNMAEVCACF